MKRFGLFLAVFTLLTVAGYADTILPSAFNDIFFNLPAGTVYYFTFVTSTESTATSANISDYDAFVQAAADAAGIGSSIGVSWKAIVSTPTANAIDHIGTLNGDILYLSGGIITTGGTAALFNNFVGLGSGTELNNDPPSGLIWTGTQANGIGSAFPMGSASSLTTFGLWNTTQPGGWLDDDPFPPIASGQEYPIRAFSSPFVFVPTPEPSTVSLCVIGFAIILVVRFRRRSAVNGKL